MPPLRRDFHLSEDGLGAALAEGSDNRGGIGAYGKRREILRRRVEAAIELERTAGRLFTAEDIRRWLQRQLMIPDSNQNEGDNERGGRVLRAGA